MLGNFERVCTHTSERFLCVCVSENVFSPMGWPKNLPKLVYLEGNILVGLPQIFCPILDPLNAHKTQNQKNDTKIM